MYAWTEFNADFVEIFSDRGSSWFDGDLKGGSVYRLQYL